MAAWRAGKPSESMSKSVAQRLAEDMDRQLQFSSQKLQEDQCSMRQRIEEVLAACAARQCVMSISEPPGRLVFSLSSFFTLTINVWLIIIFVFAGQQGPCRREKAAGGRVPWR